MIPIQKGEPGFRKHDRLLKNRFPNIEIESWTASYDDIRYITAHETADMITQILSGDGIYYGLGQYNSLHRDYIPDVISEKRYPKGKENINIPPLNPILKELGFGEEEITRIMNGTTVRQRKAIKFLINLGLNPQSILEQMKI